jgi:hypothetical protein
MRNVVACQSYHVRLQTVRGLNGPFNLLAACKRAVVNVGELNYAKTLQTLAGVEAGNGMVCEFVSR